MPLIRHRELAAWTYLNREGVEIVAAHDARDLQLPTLHIGILNMMPDRALKATERQFLRLLSAGADRYCVWVHPFTICGLNRTVETLRYVAQAYDSFDHVRSQQLDGLILTGANPGNDEITAAQYWPYFEEVVEWANDSLPAIFCSCLASHAIIKLLYGIERRRCQSGKRWGVFQHQVVQSDHPLMADMPEQYEEPRSHVFEVTAAQLNQCEIDILATSRIADFGVAASRDGIKWVFLQGHPEYDAVSLLKEYKREISRYQSGERTDYPLFPSNYLTEAARQKLDDYGERFCDAMALGVEIPVFPEADIVPMINSTWKHHASILFRNWLNQVALKKNGFNCNEAGMA